MTQSKLITGAHYHVLCVYWACVCLVADHRLRQPREDSEHRGARLQQAGDRGGRALHPRRALRHPLPGQEEVRLKPKAVSLYVMFVQEGRFIILELGFPQEF